MAAVITAAMIYVNSAAAVELVQTEGEQDGYTNDHAYNNTDPILVCGEQDFAAVMEFPLQPGTKVRSARLRLTVSEVIKPGRLVLMHLLNFNNGYAETQDFYAAAEKIGEAVVEKPGPVMFTVTGAVRKDAQGPGGFTSYRLEAKEGAQIVLPSFEGKKDTARITIE